MPTKQVKLIARANIVDHPGTITLCITHCGFLWFFLLLRDLLGRHTCSPWIGLWTKKCWLMWMKHLDLLQVWSKSESRCSDDVAGSTSFHGYTSLCIGWILNLLPGNGRMAATRCKWTSYQLSSLVKWDPVSVVQDKYWPHISCSHLPRSKVWAQCHRSHMNWL